MTIAQSLLPEFDQEMANTRRTLERIPEDKLMFQPDPKSMTLGRLAGQIAEMPGWGTMTLTQDSLDLAPGGKHMEPFVLKSRQQALDELDKNVKATRKALEKASDQDMMKDWSLLMDGKVLFTMPRITVIRSMVMNHVIHHRAQLTVYYRMVGVPVPALYGPSADEGSMSAGA